MVKEGMAGVQMAVNRAHAEMDTGMPSMVEVMPKPWPTPPTYFKLNAFTIAFQVCYHVLNVVELSPDVHLDIIEFVRSIKPYRIHGVCSCSRGVLAAQADVAWFGTHSFCLGRTGL